MILTKLQNRLEEINTLLDHAEGEQADMLFAEMFALEEEEYGLLRTYEEADQAEADDFVRQHSLGAHEYGLS